jgi:hypothetical protein
METDGQTDTKIDRQTDRKIDRITDRNRWTDEVQCFYSYTVLSYFID